MISMLNKYNVCLKIHNLPVYIHGILLNYDLSNQKCHDYTIMLIDTWLNSVESWNMTILRFIIIGMAHNMQLSVHISSGFAII